MTPLPNIGLGPSIHVIRSVIARPIRLDRRIIRVVPVVKPVQTGHEGPIVGGENQQRVVVDTGLVQGAHYVAHGCVDLYDEIPVRAQFGLSFELLGRPDRLVRGRQGQIQQKWHPVRRLPLDKPRGLPDQFIEHISGSEIRRQLAGSHVTRKFHPGLLPQRKSRDLAVTDIDIRGEVQGSRDDVGLVESVRVRSVVNGLLEVEFAQGILRKTEAQVPLSNHCGAVPGGSEKGAERFAIPSDQGPRVTVQDSPGQSCPPRIAAGQQAVARRGANPRRRMRVQKRHTLSCQGIQVRRRDLGL